MFIRNIPAIDVIIFSCNILEIFQKRFLLYLKIILESDGEYLLINTEIFHEMFHCNISAMHRFISTRNVAKIFPKRYLKYSKIIL